MILPQMKFQDGSPLSMGPNFNVIYFNRSNSENHVLNDQKCFQYLDLVDRNFAFLRFLNTYACADFN